MNDINQVLTRGVDKIYPSSEALERILRSGKKIRLYQGFDPSGIQLHIGHLVGLIKLRQFQRLGHHVIFLIGDGTGQAGDPSGKTRTREKFLTNKELRQNAKDYVMQAAKIIDFEGENKAEILYNGDWLNKLNLKDLLEIAGHFTLQQLEERDLYEERKKKNLDINMREFIYPLLQGYDSVAMNVDLEIGGTDQTFNMLAGRKLVREIQHREKFVLTTPLLTDTSGKKIGKTEGNAIALTSKPNDLFGLIMNLPDTVIIKCFLFITDLPLTEIEEIKNKLQKGDNPMIFKKRLAFELVRMLNSQKEAASAQKYFENIFQKKKFEEVSTQEYNKEEIPLVDFLVNMQLAASKSQAKRLINQKAVDVDNNTIVDLNYIIKPENGLLIKVGKHKIIRLKI
ncbi:tyrosine--tRNA ligase [Candidatus Gottesmanbacteria bacterium RIFCSPHIGHO2_02_FULL_39_14]|uniref:Tyrosine--tRNA ligase n=1 Tax=Candidatus Gottesmanbacteria bacterium RIFCSPHIGHO2_02_FULL_39_14 TaxID=1798383 RepID=A0A1F5ZX78_9BACT|nr:MAG: tyrosine--tRNA ligase [Candidatus Gottesmanbacteria bacterium RIFCSPHIGHO2_02_FULL_39_14]